jgi:zinc finger SWIM domain-containing protein 3
LESVIRFFNDNWHPIRSEWVEGMQSNVYNYLNRTNNRVESINQKLKKVISKFSNIVTFFENLMRVVSSIIIEDGQGS